MEENQNSENISPPKASFPSGVLLAGALIVVLALGAFMFLNRPQTDSPTAADQTRVESQMPVLPDETASPSEMIVTREVTLEEIAAHNTAADCWFAVDGIVYDVTEFIASNKHPGGEAITQGCGLDATGLFNTRPMGSGTPHSDNARANLANFQIGTLAQ